MTNFEASRKFAQSLDAADELCRFRDYFNFPVDKDGRRAVEWMPVRIASVVHWIADARAGPTVVGHVVATGSVRAKT